MEQEYIDSITDEGTESLFALMADKALYEKFKKGVNLSKKTVYGAPIVSALFGVADGVDGYNNTGTIYKTETPDWRQKVASTVGGAAHGLSFGVIPAKEATLGLHPDKSLKTPTEGELKAAIFLEQARKDLKNNNGKKSSEVDLKILNEMNRPDFYAKMNGGIYGDYDYGTDNVKGEFGHYTDKGKLPFHPTFSNESKYSNAQTPGGSWDHNPKEGWVYTPSQEQLKSEGYTEGLARYFQNEYGRGIDNVKMPVPYRMPTGLAEVIAKRQLQEL
jgi:hypothetical protein